MLGAAVLLFPAHTLTLQAHEQLLALLRAAHLQGCHVYFEYPVVNLSQIEDQYVQICQELAAHCTQVRLWQDQHSVVICSTDSSISKLASHCDGLHALSSIAAKHCTSLLQAPIKVEALLKYMSACYLPKRLPYATAQVCSAPQTIRPTIQAPIPNPSHRLLLALSAT